MFRYSVMSDSLWPHGLQLTRLPCPSPSPSVCLNSCPLSQWYHPTISSSIIPFSFNLQSFLASGSFPESILCIRWPKYWNFSFSISPSKEYLGLISYRIDWFDLLAVQGTPKSLLQHSSKASILRHSAFFMVQLSHPYMTIGKTITLTIQTFVNKVMFLLFNAQISIIPNNKGKIHWQKNKQNLDTSRTVMKDWTFVLQESQWERKKRISLRKYQTWNNRLVPN